jgi:ribonuclease HI
VYPCYQAQENGLPARDPAESGERNRVPWLTMRLRGQKVLARCDERGQPIADSGRVEIRYSPNDGRKYQALTANLEPLGGERVLPDDHCGPAEAPPPRDAPKKEAAARSGERGGARPRAMPRKSEARDHHRAVEAGTVLAYADGACSGNPGPAGLGVLVEDGEGRRELSEYLGTGTNNVAELTAILRVAELFAGDPRPIEIRTDSQYSIGVLSKGWKAKANIELVARVKQALARVPAVRLVYVPGHAGVPGNERADELARAAVVARASSGWVTLAPVAKSARPG